MIVTYVVFTELHCGKTATPISFLFGSSLQKTTLLDVFFTLCEQKSLPFEMAADIVLSCFFFCFFLVFFFCFFFRQPASLARKDKTENGRNAIQRLVCILGPNCSNYRLLVCIQELIVSLLVHKKSGYYFCWKKM